jgi:uncharacterized membrane protein
MRRRFTFRATYTLRGREQYGIRGWAGKPAHPPLTDFPIASYVLAAVFDCASLLAAARGFGWAHDAFVAATWVMVGGFVASVATALTGLLDWPATTAGTQVRRTVNAHALIMVTATLLALLTVVLRVRHWPGLAGTEPLITGLTVLVAGLIATGAWIGTDLVFEHGFRVEPSRDTPAWNPSEIDVLPGGQAIEPRRWGWSRARQRGSGNGQGGHLTPPVPLGGGWRARGDQGPGGSPPGKPPPA